MKLIFCYRNFKEVLFHIQWVSRTETSLISIFPLADLDLTSAAVTTYMKDGIKYQLQNIPVFHPC